MDKLASRLRHDAERIDVNVSDELDRRIRASLQGVSPETEERSARAPVRHPGFWWASSLTGIAAAVAVIAIINSFEDAPAPPAATPVDILAAVPTIDLRAETAVMTSPLHEELDALQSDIKKAEALVRRDIGL